MLPMLSEGEAGLQNRQFCQERRSSVVENKMEDPSPRNGPRSPTQPFAASGQLPITGPRDVTEELYKLQDCVDIHAIAKYNRKWVVADFPPLKKRRKGWTGLWVGSICFCHERQQLCVLGEGFGDGNKPWKAFLKHSTRRMWSSICLLECPTDADYLELHKASIRNPGVCAKVIENIRNGIPPRPADDVSEMVDFAAKDVFILPCGKEIKQDTFALIKEGGHERIVFIREFRQADFGEEVDVMVFKRAHEIELDLKRDCGGQDPEEKVLRGIQDAGVQQNEFIMWIRRSEAGLFHVDSPMPVKHLSEVILKANVDLRFKTPEEDMTASATAREGRDGRGRVRGKMGGREGGNGGGAHDPPEYVCRFASCDSLWKSKAYARLSKWHLQATDWKPEIRDVLKGFLQDFPASEPRLRPARAHVRSAVPDSNSGGAQVGSARNGAPVDSEHIEERSKESEATAAASASHVDSTRNEMARKRDLLGTATTEKQSKRQRLEKGLQERSQQGGLSADNGADARQYETPEYIMVLDDDEVIPESEDDGAEEGRKDVSASLTKQHGESKATSPTAASAATDTQVGAIRPDFSPSLAYEGCDRIERKTEDLQHESSDAFKSRELERGVKEPLGKDVRSLNLNPGLVSRNGCNDVDHIDPEDGFNNRLSESAESKGQKGGTDVAAGGARDVDKTRMEVTKTKLLVHGHGLALSSEKRSIALGTHLVSAILCDFRGDPLCSGSALAFMRDKTKLRVRSGGNPETEEVEVQTVQPSTGALVFPLRVDERLRLATLVTLSVVVNLDGRPFEAITDAWGLDQGLRAVIPIRTLTQDMVHVAADSGAGAVVAELTLEDWKGETWTCPDCEVDCWIGDERELFRLERSSGTTPGCFKVQTVGLPLQARGVCSLQLRVCCRVHARMDVAVHNKCVVSPPASWKAWTPKDWSDFLAAIKQETGVESMRINEAALSSTLQQLGAGSESQPDRRPTVIFGMFVEKDCVSFPGAQQIELIELKDQVCRSFEQRFLLMQTEAKLHADCSAAGTRIKKFLTKRLMSSDLNVDFSSGPTKRGGTAAVYFGKRRTSGQEVAVKVLDQKYSLDTLREVYRQMRRLDDARHKRVVEVVGIAVVLEDQIALVMERFAGQTLSEVLSNQFGGRAMLADGAKLVDEWKDLMVRPVPHPAVIVEVLSQAAEGLEHIHSKQIVHKDFTSNNILVQWSETGELSTKITDFHLSIVLNSASTWSIQSPPSAHDSGTIHFLPPEVLSQTSQLAPPWTSDVFQFGLVNYHLLTTEVPWSECGNNKELIQERIRDAAQAGDPKHIANSLASRLKGAWQPLVDLHARCCNANPKLRPDMQTVLKELAAMKTQLKMGRAWIFQCPDHDAQTKPECNGWSSSSQDKLQTMSYQNESFEDFEKRLQTCSSPEWNVAVIAFLGHHSQTEGFFFRDADQPIPSSTIVDLVGQHGTFSSSDWPKTVECLVLSCCFSSDVGRQVVERGVPVVLCWEGAVDDVPAATISSSFFNRVFSRPRVDRTFQDYISAFESALAEAELGPGGGRPVLWVGIKGDVRRFPQ